MDRMVMLIGPTGSGKTFFRSQHLAALPCVSPDDLIIGKFSARKRASAWAHARNLAIEMMLGHEEFVVDAQFVDPALRYEWTCLAAGFGYRTLGLVFATPWKQLRKNQQARGARGHYGEIPLSVQKEMYQNFKKEFDGSNLKHENWFDVIRVVRWGKTPELGGIL